MSLSNCKRCGNLFSRVSQPVCPECIRKEDKQLEQANGWMRDNPGQTINALSEATGIELPHILKWVRQKRITLADKSCVVICKRCGEAVFSGTLCDRCKLSLSHDLSQEIKAIKESEPSDIKEENQGMYYKREDREKRRF